MSQSRILKAIVGWNNRQWFEVSGGAAGAVISIYTIACYGYITNLIPGNHSLKNAALGMKIASTVFTSFATTGIGAFAIGKVGGVIDYCTGGRTLISCAVDYHTKATIEEKKSLVMNPVSPGGTVKSFARVKKEIKQQFKAMGEDMDKLFAIVDSSDEDLENPPIIQSNGSSFVDDHDTIPDKSPKSAKSFR